MFTTDATLSSDLSVSTVSGSSSELPPTTISVGSLRAYQIPVADTDLVFELVDNGLRDWLTFRDCDLSA